MVERREHAEHPVERHPPAGAGATGMVERVPGGMGWRTLGVLLLLGVLIAARPAGAQPGGGLAGAPPAAPAFAALPSESAPLLDGVVLGDPVWDEAAPATGFRQTQPDEGAPASERTEVRVVFTDSTLYVGVVCYDADPGSIAIADSRRDASLDDGDSVQFILDTFLDRQSGFVFGTSPAGQEYDGQVVNAGEGRLGRSTTTSSGSGAGFNGNWDGAWDVRTSVSDVGWSAEFAIPFRTLSYPDRDVQTWGLNVQRNIRRRNEIVYWAPLPRQYNLLRLSMAGQLSGIRPAPAVRDLKIVPYVAGDLTRFDEGRRTTALGDAGVDLKYNVTPALTLDLTYNTDFAQVEVDDQQINLDRFNLFFPEKRPFFLENAGVFLGEQRPPGGRRRPGPDRAVLQPPHRNRSGRTRDPDPRGRPPVGQGLRRGVGRPPQHADGGDGRRDAREQLHRRAGVSRPAEQLADRRDLRQSAGHRRAGRRPRLQPDLRHGRTRRAGAEQPDCGIRRRHRYPRPRGERSCLQRGLGSQLRAVALHAGLRRGGRQLQPGSRVPEAAGLPQRRFGLLVHHPAAKHPVAASGAAARHVQPVLELQTASRRARSSTSTTIWSSPTAPSSRPRGTSPARA